MFKLPYSSKMGKIKSTNRYLRYFHPIIIQPST